MKVNVYTDGAARGNPGPGGFGVVIQFFDSQGNEHRKELSQGYIKTTNNRMELLAAIRGLEMLNKPSEVNLYSDSKYLVDAFNKGWIENWKNNRWKTTNHQPVKNQDLWKALIELSKIHKISFNWVKGHNGFELNERCDRLAVEAAESKDLIKDMPIAFI